MKRNEIEGRKFRFKIAVIGDEGVGKTPLIKKFTKDSFKKDYVKTIGAQFSAYDKEMGDDKVRLIFWDIAGQDTFAFLRPSFFNNSKTAIIVFCLDYNKLGIETINHIPYWKDCIKKFCGDIPIILFGNRVNLAYGDSLDDSDVQKIVQKYNFTRYYVTSINNTQNVIKAFNEIIEILYNKYKKLSKQNSD